MINSQRKIHKWTWSLVTPLLLVLLYFFSQPDTELTPANATLPTAPSNPNTGALP